MRTWSWTRSRGDGDERFVREFCSRSVSSASMTRGDETLSEGVMVGRLGWTGQVGLTVLSSR